jgi:nucleotide-binding universal stress UspA family protein
MNGRLKVMIAYDGSGCADAAIDDLCRAGLPPDPEILIVSVLNLPAINLPISEFDLVSLASHRALMVIEQAKVHSRREIEKVKTCAAKAADRLRSRFPEWEIRCEVLYGKPAVELLRRAAEWKPDLIVVGSHGRGAIGRFFLGSVSQKVAEEADCPVRLVRRGAENDGAPAKIIAGDKNLSGQAGKPN